VDDEQYRTWVGKVVEGRYRVLDLIGRGGMGEVYKVEHVRMGKIAAMKLLHAELAREPEVVARFNREARAVSKLSHPHTVQVFDFGEHDGALFLVMEYVKGRDLGGLSRDLGALPYPRALPMMIQLCLALEEAHGAGIVHRDVKPENVLVYSDTDGADYIKVLDFGLALLREGKDRGNITAQGNVIGTPYYMAPEQIRGEAVDHRVDIYAIGATLYRLITGVVPFPAKTPVGVLTKCLTEPLEPPCTRRPDLNIPGELEAVIMKAMAKDPAERFGTTRELRKALEGCMKTLSVEPVRILGGSSLDPWSQSSMPGIKVSQSPFSSENNLKRADLDQFEKRLKRKRWLQVLIPLLVLGMVGGGLAYWLTRPKPVETAVRKEREPNHDTAHANPIARGQPVKGQIGKRISETQSDVDAYVFEVKAAGPVVLTAHLTGIPYINTSLQIYDAAGHEVAAADNGPARAPEILPNVVLKPGKYFAVVQEVAGKTPGTNINDWYTLTVDWRPLKPTDEVEPNDALEVANRIRSGETVEGYLSRSDDADFFRPVGAGGGALSVSLKGVKGLDLRLRVVGLERTSDAKLADAGPAHQPLRALWERCADDHRAGEGEQLVKLPWPQGTPAPVIIVERSPGSPDAPELVDRSYHLTYTFHRGEAGHLPAPRIAPPSARSIAGHRSYRPRRAVMSSPPPRPRPLAPPPRSRPLAPPPRAMAAPHPTPRAMGVPHPTPRAMGVPRPTPRAMGVPRPTPRRAPPMRP